MKKTLVEMELSEFYKDDENELVIRPNGVEPKYDGEGIFKSEITKDYPKIKFTKAMRDNREALDKAINGGKVVSVALSNRLFCLEFGLETLENDSFTMLGVKVKQSVQRWFLNIWNCDGECLVETYQNIEGVLDSLDSFIKTNGLLKVTMNDFIEKLTTNENLLFIEKATAQPTKKDNKDVWKDGYKCLQSVENSEDLMTSLISWLGFGFFNSEVDDFLEGEFKDALNDDDDQAVYKVVDKTFKPKCIEYFRELERILEWYDSDYDPRCLTDNSIKVINEQLNDLAKVAISDLKKSVGSEGRGGWYIKDNEGNKNLFIADGINLTKEQILFIEESGFEMFNQNLNSALHRLGYTIDNFVGCYKGVGDFNTIDYKMKLTYVLRLINPKKEVK